jgi:hypothetical protein
MSGHAPGAAPEHAVLCRHLGSVQDRVSRLMLEKEMALMALNSEVVRLRGHLVVARTYLLWALRPDRLRGARPQQKSQRARRPAGDLCR